MAINKLQFYEKLNFIKLPKNLPKYVVNFINKFLFKEFKCKSCNEKFSANSIDIKLTNLYYDFLFCDHKQWTEEDYKLFRGTNIFIEEGLDPQEYSIRFLNNDKNCLPRGYGNCNKLIYFNRNTAKKILRGLSYE